MFCYLPILESQAKVDNFFAIPVAYPTHSCLSLLMSFQVYFSNHHIPVLEMKDEAPGPQITVDNAMCFILEKNYIKCITNVALVDILPSVNQAQTMIEC